MTNEKAPPATIDEYIAGLPAHVQDVLTQIRMTIRYTAPDADETIKYGMPTFTLNGNLVHFGAFKTHIGFYPPPRGMDKFKDRLTRYEGPKGSLRFPLDEPIPYDLIAEIVKARVRENAGRAQAKAKK